MCRAIQLGSDRVLEHGCDWSLSGPSRVQVCFVAFEGFAQCSCWVLLIPVSVYLLYCKIVTIKSKNEIKKRMIKDEKSFFFFGHS